MYQKFIRKFFVSQCQKSLQGNPSVMCFRNFPVAKSFLDKQWGVSRFSVENFLSHSAENIRRGTFLCFTKFLVSNKIMDRRGEGGMEHHKFLSKYFCLTVPKHFVEEPFHAVFQKISGRENVNR